MIQFGIVFLILVIAVVSYIILKSTDQYKEYFQNSSQDAAQQETKLHNVESLRTDVGTYTPEITEQMRLQCVHLDDEQSCKLSKKIQKVFDVSSRMKFDMIVKYLFNTCGQSVFNSKGQLQQLAIYDSLRPTDFQEISIISPKSTTEALLRINNQGTIKQYVFSFPNQPDKKSQQFKAKSVLILNKQPKISKQVPIFNNHRLIIEFMSGLDSDPIVSISTLDQLVDYIDDLILKNFRQYVVKTTQYMQLDNMPKYTIQLEYQ